MTRISYLKSLFVSFAVVVLATVVFSTQAHAQATTSSMRIEITDESGNRVGNVPVEILHIPTGRVVTTMASASGIANVRGLAVGGPYEVKIPSGASYSAERVTDIILKLDETEVVPLTARSATLEEIVVTAEMVAERQAVGVGRDFDRAKIDGTPSLARDFVSTLATEPKILVDNSVARGPAVSMAGANFRFNSVTIDGVAQNDNFGLSKNASATQRTPISIDAIEAINVNIAPYDVTYGNFVGGNINIVTKSGTNDFEGSVYYFSTDDSLTGDESDGVDLQIGDFDETYYGFTFGGPIIRDRLFFFANYEKFETTRPANTQTIDNIAGVTQQDVDTVRSIFQTEYGFDPGPFATSDDDEDEKILLKLDWNINDDHRASLTYQSADGDVLFDDFPEVAVLNSNRYNINEKLTAYSARLFSQWTNDFSTEVRIGTKDVENRQVSVGATTDQFDSVPDFAVSTFSGGLIAAGNDRFRHTNELDNESDLIRIRADWQLGNHLLTGGFEREEYTVRNLFLPFSKGQYNFSQGEDPLNTGQGDPLYGNLSNRENDPDEPHREGAGLGIEAFEEAIHQHGRRDPERNGPEDRDRPQRPEHIREEAVALFFTVASAHPVVEGDERDRERTAREQVVENVRNEKGRIEGVGAIVRPDLRGEHGVANEAEHAREQDTGREKHRRGAQPGRPRFAQRFSSVAVAGLAFAFVCHALPSPARMMRYIAAIVARRGPAKWRFLPIKQPPPGPDSGTTPPPFAGGLGPLSVPPTPIELPFSIERARCGAPVLKLTGHATDSLYRADDAAMRAATGWFDEGREEGCGLFILIGAGLGRWAAAFPRDAGVRLLVWDPFPGVRDALEEAGHRVRSTLADHPRVHLVEDVDAFDEALARWLPATGRVSVRVHPGYEACCRFEHRYVAHALRSANRKPNSLQWSDAVMNWRGLRALRSLPFSRSVDALDDHLANTTAVVASAGPSLDPAVEVLAGHEGAARFVAVQRLEVFHRHGARVDFATCVDPSDLFRVCRVPDDAPFGTLVADTSCDAGMIEARRDATYLMNLRSPYLQQFAWDALGLDSLDEPCLTVSEIGVLLAARMGARRIVLAGVDYGGQDERYPERFEAIDSSGQPAPTNAHYFHGARYLSMRCTRLQREGIEIFRLGRGGLPIAGTQTIDVETLAEILAEAPPCPAVATGPTFTPARLDAVEQVYRGILDHLALPLSPAAVKQDATRFGHEFESLPAEKVIADAKARLAWIAQLRDEARAPTDQGLGSRQMPPSHASTT